MEYDQNDISIKSSTTPIYKDIYSQKKFLTERMNFESEEVWANYVMLDFDPYSEKNTEILAYSLDYNFLVNSSHFSEIYTDFRYKFHILSNDGLTDGSEILNWIYNFYDTKNKFYNQNIYDRNAKDVHVYVINKNFKKRIKINLVSCTPHNPIFHFRNKKNEKQISITLSSKTIKNISNYLK
tara:strand:- start:1469 stop:2014 length:546 start_codon:yes stop_codon:yes gene_type:complete